MKTFVVYILKCSDETYYTGVTSNLEQRIIQHNTGHFKGAYTSSRLPVELVWHESFSDPYVAFSWEKRIKKWSGAKKEALIAGRLDLLPELSKKKFDKD